jgi:hypothetical protein
VQGSVALAALLGLAVSGRVAFHLKTGKLVNPSHWSDFWWYGATPAAVYVAVGAAAAGVSLWPGQAPGLIGAVLVAALLVSIRNAWDLVTWLAPRAETPEKL